MIPGPMTPGERAEHDATMERIARLLREPAAVVKAPPPPSPVRHHGPNRAMKREATHRNRR